MSFTAKHVIPYAKQQIYVANHAQNSKALSLHVNIVQLLMQLKQIQLPLSATVLTKEEMKITMKTLHAELRKITKQQDRLSKKAEKLMEDLSIRLNEADSADMRKIFLNEGQTNFELEKLSLL